jgi:enoyl-CoA hydratase
MGPENIILQKDGPVGIIRMNRPSALNALNAQTVKELHSAVDEMEVDRNIRVVILTGEGKSFIAGADIKQMSDLSPLEARHFAEIGQGLTLKMEASRLPYIAAVNGYALGGGCELMMACDIAIASNRAIIGQPEINLGISPGFGGTQRLPRLVGYYKGFELLLTGENIPAEEAFRIGLVNKVVEPEKLMEEAMALALKIASKSQVQVAFIKRMARKGLDMELSQGLDLEAALFASSFSTYDQKEGMRAFIEKRKPEFQHR